MGYFFGGERASEENEVFRGCYFSSAARADGGATLFPAVGGFGPGTNPDSYFGKEKVGGERQKKGGESVPATPPDKFLVPVLKTINRTQSDTIAVFRKNIKEILHEFFSCWIAIESRKDVPAPPLNETKCISLNEILRSPGECINCRVIFWTFQSFERDRVDRALRERYELRIPREDERTFFSPVAKDCSTIKLVKA